jgi:drug/metabolite transporter (DMT)-like permease
MLGGVANLKTLADLAGFGFAFLLYSLLLQRLALNLAQTILTLPYVCVIVAAAVFLNEPISAVRWMGMLLSSAALESFRLRFEFSGTLGRSETP